MKISQETKFEIGQVVRVKGAKNQFLIVGILLETCSAGTQVHYQGYHLLPEKSYITRENEEKPTCIADKVLRIDEVALVEEIK